MGFQWQICIIKFWTCAPPLGPIFFIFILAPLLGLVPTPVWEILDPLLALAMGFIEEFDCEIWLTYFTEKFRLGCFHEVWLRSFAVRFICGVRLLGFCASNCIHVWLGQAIVQTMVQVIMWQLCPHLVVTLFFKFEIVQGIWVFRGVLVSVNFWLFFTEQVFTLPL